MALLRIKQNPPPPQYDGDPYELFSLDEPRRGEGGWPLGLWLALGFGLLAALALILGVLWQQQTLRLEADAARFAYVEIKVIDANGKPVPGALVKDAERSLGLSDSFGEWRRYVRAEAGAVLRYSVSKKGASGKIVSASKNIAVPAARPSGDTELELKATVQLPARMGDRKGSDEVAPAPSTAKAKVVEQALALAGAASDSAPLAPPALEISVSGVAAEAAPASTLTYAQAKVELSFESAWVETASEPRLLEVGAAMRQRLGELGIQLSRDAPWLIHLRHIPAPPKQSGGSEGLILAEHLLSGSVDGPRQRLFAYMRSYQQEAMPTARDLLYIATQAARKTYTVEQVGGTYRLAQPSQALWLLRPGRLLEDAQGTVHRLLEDPASPNDLILEASANPCMGSSSCQLHIPGYERLPPYEGWRRLELKIFGGLDQDDVFVSGFSARRVRPGVYQFWGAPKVAANVTVLRAGKLLRRDRLQLDAGGASLSLPKAAISANPQLKPKS